MTWSCLRCWKVDMKYSKEVVKFITENVKGKTTIELAELVNEKRGTNFTESKMKSFKSNRGLKSDIPKGLRKGMPTDLYPQEIRDFIRENIKGVGPKTMAKLLNNEFGTNYTMIQIKAYYGNNNLTSGLTGYFPKGHIPPNKGKKGQWAEGCEKGWFKKGNAPANYQPVGSERINTYGVLDVKVADPNKWRAKHQLIWEELNGPIPEGYVILFADSNKQNIDISNLILISRQQLLIMNKQGLIHEDPELTKTGVTISEVYSKIYELNKED